MKKTFVCRLALAMVLVMCFASITAFAADTEYAPSIEGAAVPQTIDVTVTKADGTTESIALADVLIVSYNQAKALIADAATSAEAKAACEKFVTVYDALKASGGVKERIKNIDEFVADNFKKTNCKYVVSDIFELNIGDHTGTLEGNGKVTVRFDNSIVKAKSGELVVAHAVGNEWKIVPNADVKVTAESIEVTFDELCAVAFISATEGQAIDTTDTPDTSDPDKGPNTGLIIAIVVVVVVGAGTATFFILKKKGIIEKIQAKIQAKIDAKK